MCGIAGMVGETDAALLRRMLDLLKHRGPDDWGTFLDDGVALGQTRLSIVPGLPELSLQTHVPPVTTTGQPSG